MSCSLSSFKVGYVGDYIGLMFWGLNSLTGASGGLYRGQKGIF